MRMNSHLVSIALCTYNGEKFIEQLLLSLLSQTYKNIEILVFDDNSNDKTAQIILKFAAIDHRIKMFSNPENIGFNNNFRNAIASCSGELIAPCDQDDIWDHEKIEVLVNSIGNKDLVYCDSALIDSVGTPLNKRLSSLRRMYYGKNPLAFLLTNCISGHAMLVRKNLLSTIDIPEDLYYDWWIAIAACARNGIGYVDRPLVKFRRHQGAASGVGISGNESTIELSDFLNQKTRIIGWIADQNGRSAPDAKSILNLLPDIHTTKAKFKLFYFFIKNIKAILYIPSKQPISLTKKLFKFFFK